mgnify:CR=1 FL=1
MSYFRTPEHRARRAEQIRQWKPWEKSTGPRTAKGKAASSTNARKHGMRSRDALEELRQLRSLINAWKELRRNDRCAT